MIYAVSLFQALILSGALGYISLEYLKQHDAVSNYISKTDANYWRVLCGVLDYLIYLVVHGVLSFFMFHEPFDTIITIIITVISAFIAVRFYGNWRVKHKRAKSGAQILTAREQAFADRGENSAIRIDIFAFDGRYIASGYLISYDVDAELAGDLLLHPLDDDDILYTDERDFTKSQEYVDLYIDQKNKMKIYTTPTFWERA